MDFSLNLISQILMCYCSEKSILTKQINDSTYTETCQKYSVTEIFYYIFHIKQHFVKTLFQSRLLFDFDDFFTNKNRIK